MAVAHQRLDFMNPELPEAVYAIRGENDSLYLVDFLALSDGARVMRIPGVAERWENLDGKWWPVQAIDAYDDDFQLALEDTISLGYRTNWELKGHKPGWLQTKCTSIVQLTANEVEDILRQAAVRAHVPGRGQAGQYARKTGQGRKPAFWLYKNNAGEGGPAGYCGDWLPDVFSQAAAVEWGGHHSTRSPEVANYLNEDVREGDVIVAYQTDDKLIVGFCRIERIAGPRNHKRLWLKPIHQLAQPLPIHVAKRGTILERSKAVNGPLMLRKLTGEEMRVMVLLAGAPVEVLRGVEC